MPKSDFIATVTKGVVPPPAYFLKNANLDPQKNVGTDELFKTTKNLNPNEFEMLAGEFGALMLDTRDALVYSGGFVPNSIFIGIDGDFSVWVDTLISDLKQKILIVTDEGREKEVVTRLARLGYSQILGFLNGGFEAWKKEEREVDEITTITPEELVSVIGSGNNIELLDVRNTSEYASEHIIGSLSLPLDNINENMSLISRKKTYYLYCENGYRSMIFISILKARGFGNLVQVKGGLIALKKSGKFNLSKYTCPTTLL